MKRNLWTVLATFALVVPLLPLSAAPAVAVPGTSVFVNEIHYDNVSTDTGEAIEVAGPAGTDLTGWSVALYNGSSSQLNVYGTIPLSGIIPDQQSGFGTLSFARAGIQNGSPDGLALVDASNAPVQFLSYEGTFTAASGPAAGMTSTDIGVQEGSSTAIGDSLQLIGSGSVYEDFSWSGPSADSFGDINAGQTFAGNASVLVSCSNINTDVGTATSSAVSASDADGIVTYLSIAVDPAPAAGSISLTSITPATVVGGLATADVSVSADVPAQIYSVTVTATNSDATPQTGTCGLIVTVSPSTVTSIYAIQNTTDPSGDSPYKGDFVLTEGVVTAVFGSDVFIQDGKGPWRGLYVSDPTFTPAVGDQVKVVGTVSEHFGLTEIAGGSVSVVDTHDVPDAAVLATGDIGQEQWESVFVRADDATVVNPNLGFGEWSIDDGSGAIVVDDFGSYDYIPAAGDDVKFLQGPLNYSFGAFKIEPRSSADMLVITPIGTVQGSVSDTDNGATFDSAYVDNYVTIQAVVTQQVLARTSSGGNSWGYFLQNTAATADDDPNSSDGIYLYTGYYDNIYIGPGYYTPQVGDELIIRAQVSEYYHLTELSDASIVQIVGHYDGLDAVVPAFVTAPPGDLNDANRYWERHEGMRAEIPTGSFTLAGRDVFASTFDGEVWVATPDSPIASLSGYERRAFRDERNLSSGEAPGNGFRIIMGSLGIKATADDNTALIAPVRTFDTLTAPAVGGVYFSFSKYQIQVGSQLEFSEGLNPADNYPPQAPDVAEEYSLTTFNMENLYDYRDDPFDGCDFTGNSGCSGVYPPFDYVPVSDEVYQTRLGEIASQVINDLNAPDVVLAQELEDQDICTVNESWGLVCGTSDNADGKPDTLQELTTKIYAQSGIKYDTAYDRDGADDRGIVNGYMFRTDRVELLPAMADDPVLGSDPQVDYRSDGLGFNTQVSNPKSLNADLPDDVDTSTGTDGDLVFTRAPLVGYFRIWQEAVGFGPYTDTYLIDNHFSSGPDSRVGQRTEQAAYNAAIVAALQDADPGVRVVVGGDLNVYPDSDQLAGLYAQGMTNLFYTLLAANPVAAYSYVYQGQAQTLDQLFVTPSMLSDLNEMRSAHINSDWPSDYVGDGARGTSDHDPQVAQFVYTDNVSLDTLEALVEYYVDEGLITGRNTEKILLDRFDRARRFMNQGKTAAYRAQLQAFINQVEGFTPQFVDQHASDVLTYDAQLLLMM